ERSADPVASAAAHAREPRRKRTAARVAAGTIGGLVKRWRSAFTRGGGLALGVGGLVALPTAAAAAAGPGAAYSGKAADGATVTLTVSSDGTLVDSYHVTGILGKDVNGNTCQGTAADVKNDIWPGAPISAGSFQDQSTTTFSFTGTFDG